MDNRDSSKFDWRTNLIDSGSNRPPRDWLQSRGSLTERLQSLGAFKVKVLRQRLAYPTHDEAAILRLNRKQLVWTREVALYCNDTPVVFAHTVLGRSPRGPVTRWLRQLGTRSLGALLFAQLGFSRGRMQFKRIDRRHPLFRRAAQGMQLSDSIVHALWARRSTFSYGSQSVLVTEIFSPSLYIST